MALNFKNKPHDSFKKEPTLRSPNYKITVAYISELPKLKRLIMLNVTEDTEQLKPSNVIERE